MDISAAVAALKKEPGFAARVGMILTHTGIVRGFSRKDGRNVLSLTVTPDTGRMESIRREIEAAPGIFRVLAEAKSGHFRPGDEILHLVVAGDIREHVTPALAELLERIKNEAVRKTEHLE